MKRSDFSDAFEIGKIKSVNLDKFISMKIIIRVLILLLVISCNKKSDENNTDYETPEELNKRISEGKPF